MALLPFSLIGVVLALPMTGTTLDIFSMIGCIMLMGLVAKNAILLVDFANRARRAGAGLHEALLQSGQVRLRPILMTTASTIGHNGGRRDEPPPAMPWTGRCRCMPIDGLARGGALQLTRREDCRDNN